MSTMNKSAPECLEKMDASAPAHEAKMERRQSEEESSGSDLADFKTPLQPAFGLKSRLAGTQNTCDSGFSSVYSAAFSDKSSSLSSSTRSSPDLDTLLGGRRVTLGTCEFSPVTRETFSVIRSRKLNFHTGDLLPVSSQLHFADEDANSQEGCSGDSETPDKQECDDGIHLEETENSLSPVSPGLFNFQNEAVSRQMQRLIDEDLEVSLQDMSLEESSSSSSALSSRSGSGSNSPFHHTEIKKDLCHNREGSPSLTCSYNKETDKVLVTNHLLNWIVEVSKPQESNGPNTLSLSSHKTTFMKALLLTGAHTNTDNIITDLAHFDQSLSPYPLHNQALSHSVTQPSTLTPCCHPQVSPANPSISITKSNLDEACPVSFQSGAPHHLCKSPCKRTGVKELDVDFILSPTKSRKMQSSEEKSVTCAARKIFHGDLSTNHASNTDSLELQARLQQPALDHSRSSRLEPSLCQCSEPCIPDTSDGHLCKKLRVVLQKSLPQEPSRLIGRNIGVPKLDIIEALHKNFNLCLARIMSFLEPEDLNNVCMVSKAWRQAFEADSTSFHRYRQFLSDLKAKKQTMLVYSGKENVGEKAIDKPRTKPMTESKGCFSTLQFQASPHNVQPILPKTQPKSSGQSGVQWGDELRLCPSCQHSALVRPHQGRAVCRNPSCGFDFCTQCFAAYHHPKPCKPLGGCHRSVAKKDVAGSLKSKKSLKRL